MTELEYLLKQINDEVEDLEVSLGRGSAKDYAEYQHLCGKIRGLLVAEDFIKALKERIENNDE